MNNLLPALPIGNNLKRLIGGCEKSCYHGCCGIRAFSFSPFWIAASLANWGQLEETVILLNEEIDKMIFDSVQLEPNEDGFVCSILGTNTNFSHASIHDLGQRLKRNIRLARRVIDYSSDLQELEPGSALLHVTYRSDEDTIDPGDLLDPSGSIVREAIEYVVEELTEIRNENWADGEPPISKEDFRSGLIFRSMLAKSDKRSVLYFLYDDDGIGEGDPMNIHVEHRPVKGFADCGFWLTNVSV